MSKVSELLYLNDEFADVNFTSEIDLNDQKVPANKANFSVLSPTFRRMFFGEMREQSDVVVVNATIDAFKEFLQFFYLADVTLTMKKSHDWPPKNMAWFSMLDTVLVISVPN